MKHIVIATEEYTDMVYNVFLPSFKKQHPNEIMEIDIIESTVKKYNEIVSSPTNTFGYQDFIDYKFRKTIEMLEKNPGEVIHITDPDIVYFKPITEFLDNVMENYDMAISCEDTGRLNVGQIIIRSNECTINFIKEWYRIYVERKVEWDEEIINEMFANVNELSKFIDYNKVYILPYHFCITSQWNKLTKQQKLNIFSYHATHIEFVENMSIPNERVKSKINFLNYINNWMTSNGTIEDITIHFGSNYSFVNWNISVWYKNLYRKYIGEDWFNYCELYTRMVDEATNGSHFVEVGSWRGKSALYMASAIINKNKNIIMDCVDIWDGHTDWVNDFIDNEFILKNENISDTEWLYKTFIDNVSPVSHIIKPVRLKSIDASKLYEDESLDFVFIDASHIYEDVKNDLISWYPKVKKGGYIGGHDYSPFWFGVVNAVDEFFKDKNFEILPPTCGIIGDPSWIHKKE